MKASLSRGGGQSIRKKSQETWKGISWLVQYWTGDKLEEYFSFLWEYFQNMRINHFPPMGRPHLLLVFFYFCCFCRIREIHIIALWYLDPCWQPGLVLSPGLLLSEMKVVHNPPETHLALFMVENIFLLLETWLLAVVNSGHNEIIRLKIALFTFIEQHEELRLHKL